MEKEFILEEAFITLGQFLKSVAVISSGGMAKAYLETYPVFLNGEKENRRGKKLYPGDRVTLSEEVTYLILSEEGAAREKAD